MALNITWSPDFSVGIDIIDEQHKRIFGYLDEIEHAIVTRNPAEVEHVVKSLVDYAISHNTFEESLMEKAGYPMFEAHHQVHEAFKARALGYVSSPVRL